MPKAFVGDFFLEAGEQCDFFGSGMESFNIWAEFDILCGKSCFANHDGNLLWRCPIVAREGERCRPRRILHRNWQKTERVAFGLRKKFGRPIFELCGRKLRRACDAESVAQPDLFGSDGASLRNGRRGTNSAQD